MPTLNDGYERLLYLRVNWATFTSAWNTPNGEERGSGNIDFHVSKDSPLMERNQVLFEIIHGWLMSKRPLRDKSMTSCSRVAETSKFRRRWKNIHQRIVTRFVEQFPPDDMACGVTWHTSSAANWFECGCRNIIFISYLERRIECFAYT